MDLVTLDISAATDAEAGEMVEFLGENAPVDDIARLAGTLAYEVLTNLSGVQKVIA